MLVCKLPQMTPEQVKRQDLQVQWLISALRRTNEPRPYRLDRRSLSVPRVKPR